MDYIIVPNYNYCEYCFADYQRLTKIDFLDDFGVQSEMRSQEEEGLSDEDLDALILKREAEAEAEDGSQKTNWAENLGLDKEGKNVTMTNEYMRAFAPPFQRFLDSGKRILFFDFTFPLARMINDSVIQITKTYSSCHFHCFAFFHNDADTPLVNHTKPPENCLVWRDWYKKNFDLWFPQFRFVEIPYKFELNDDYLWGFVDRENPHLPDGRERRKWLGNAQQRYERGLAAGSKDTAERAEKRRAELKAKGMLLPLEAPHVD
jgi:hypothetical protein